MTEEVVLVSRSRVNTFLRRTICSVSGCIGRIEEKFNVERCLGLNVFSTDSICTDFCETPRLDGCYLTSRRITFVIIR